MRKEFGAGLNTVLVLPLERGLLEDGRFVCVDCCIPSTRRLVHNRYSAKLCRRNGVNAHMLAIRFMATF